MANAIFFTVGGCVPTMADAGRDELIRSLEELPVAAILTELSTHTFVAANDAAAAVFGSAAKLRGTDVLERIEPHDREAAKAAYKALADKVSTATTLCAGSSHRTGRLSASTSGAAVSKVPASSTDCGFSRPLWGPRPAST